MIVRLPRLTGFCPGVKNAEKNLFISREAHDRRIHVLGYLINNSRYIRKLTEHDVITVDKPEDLPENVLVAVRTHGLDRKIEEMLRKDHEVLDLTCINVKRVQLKILEHSRNGFFVIITGKKKHPETLGLKSYADHHLILETEGDLQDLLRENGLVKYLDASGCRQILIVSQTTGNQEFFYKVIEKISNQFGAQYHIEKFDSICPVTSKKEKEALVIQKTCDVSFVIGDPLSSNAAKLYKVLKEQSEKTWFVEDLDGLLKLGLKLDHDQKALVVSSASTPKFLEDEVVGYLQSL